MSGSILQDILAATRQRVAVMPPPDRRIFRKGDVGRFRKALDSARPAFIAEIKRASPSRGVLRASVDVCDRAVAYQQGGAVAISVLTEPHFFQGSNLDFTNIGEAVDLPLLRKDFIISEVQLFESAEIGASAVLLIAAILSQAELSALRRTAEDHLGMAALVEVHNAEEFQQALDAGACLIGINNRDLHTFDVSLQVSERLAGLAPSGVTLVAESGVRTAADVKRLRDVGINVFLVGEALMLAPDPAAALRGLAGVAR